MACGVCLFEFNKYHVSLFDYYKNVVTSQIDVQNPPIQTMSEITVSAGKLQRLLDYLQQIGLDPVAIGATVNIVPARIMSLDAHQPLPALQYAWLYKAAVKEMQKLGHPIPWAAGIGSDVMKPIAAPLIGGLVSSTIMVLFVIPVFFFWVRSWQHRGLVRR